MVLSDRLLTVAKMVPVIQKVADIGCDHGKAAVWLIKNGRADYAVCTDLSGRSLNKARRLAESNGLIPRIVFREGNGFDVISRGEVQAAVIAGMGGDLIKNILSCGGEKVPDIIIVSCNKKADVLRQWLCETGFIIQDEELVLENNKFYPVIRARRGSPYKLSRKELEFGPVLLKKKPEVLKRYVLQCINTAETIRKELKDKSARSVQAQKEINERLSAYNEVIKCLQA